MTPNAPVVGWKTAPLLARHYAALAGLLVQFVHGPQKDGPELTVAQAERVITTVYGRASRCTYTGLGLVSHEALQAAIATETGERISVAEATAWTSELGKLGIMQPVCQNGHLPARFTGPVSFQFQGTDQQCPVCRSRVADPEPTEFLLVWTERRLGHQAERQVDGGDGQLVPTSKEDILREVGTLHSWFTQVVVAGVIGIDEIAMVLFHGMADGVPPIQNGTDVIAALRDPRAAGLDDWRCGNVLRAAHGARLKARNPFSTQGETHADLGGGQRGNFNLTPTQTWQGNNHRVSTDVLMSLGTIDGLIVVLCSFAYTNQHVVKSVNQGLPPDIFASELYLTLCTHGMELKKDFYLHLCRSFPGRAGDIIFMASVHGVRITEADLA